MMGKVGALEFFFAFICSLQHRDHIYSHSREHGKSKWRDRETGVNAAKGEAQEIHR